MLKKLKNIAKDLLAITWIRRMYEGSTRSSLEVFGSHRLASVIYSTLGFLTFNREQYAVLTGRRNYYRNLAKDRATHVELRRNVHRLEKGILMQPRRDIFARDYITETIEFYEQAIRQFSADNQSFDRAELEWAHNVLKEYFRIVKTGDKSIDIARERFNKTEQAFSPDTEHKVPYERGKGKKSKANYDDLLDLAMQRRSVRWFEQKPVPRELIDKAIMVGRQSPTACNRLPYEYRIFDDPELVKKVAGLPFGAAGYSHNIPTIIVVVGKLNSYFSPRDRHAIYVDASLASMAFMFALETLGLSSSVINWPDFEPLEKKMQKTLGLAYDERVIMLMAVGYPDPKGLVAYSEKKSLDVIRKYNEAAKK